MKVKNYDKNFEISSKLNISDIVWIDAQDKCFKKYGFCDGNITSGRLSYEAALQTKSEGLINTCKTTAGGRIRFATDSDYIAVKVVFKRAHYPTVMSATACVGFDLYKFENGSERFAGCYRPPLSEPEGTYESLINLREGKGCYTINFPLFCKIDKLYIGLKKESLVYDGEEYVNEKYPVVFYGSSITHGAAASRPGNTYEAFISQKYNLDYVNLGFAGLAKGEEKMAEYISSLNMSAFVMDYDHNASTVEDLEKTHFKFYQIIRNKHQTIPIIMVSKPDFFTNPTVNTIRRNVIFNNYQTAVKNGDKNVYFIDGERLFDGDMYESCTADGCHPNDLGFYRMAEVIGKKLHDVML